MSTGSAKRKARSVPPTRLTLLNNLSHQVVGFSPGLHLNNNLSVLRECANGSR